MFSYETVSDEIARIVADRSRGGEPFSSETVAQSTDLASRLSKDWPKPTVGRGYWPTIIFNWDGTQVEIFADHLEVYQFRYNPAKIEHFSHTPGEMFSDDFMAALAEAKSPSEQ